MIFRTKLVFEVSPGPKWSGGPFSDASAGWAGWAEWAEVVRSGPFGVGLFRMPPSRGEKKPHP